MSRYWLVKRDDGKYLRRGFSLSDASNEEAWGGSATARWLNHRPFDAEKWCWRERTGETPVLFSEGMKPGMFPVVRFATAEEWAIP